jgi:hypothetical protein
MACFNQKIIEFAKNRSITRWLFIDKFRDHAGKYAVAARHVHAEQDLTDTASQ